MGSNDEKIASDVKGGRHVVKISWVTTVILIFTFPKLSE